MQVSAEDLLDKLTVCSYDLLMEKPTADIIKTFELEPYYK